MPKTRFQLFLVSFQASADKGILVRAVLGLPLWPYITLVVSVDDNRPQRAGPGPMKSPKDGLLDRPSWSLELPVWSIQSNHEPIFWIRFGSAGKSVLHNGQQKNPVSREIHGNIFFACIIYYSRVVIV